MIVEVDVSSPVPAFEQVRHQIATMVDTGRLPAGTRLPTIRQLAHDLGLAPGTVARAYRELEAGGVVATRVRHGTTVLARPSLSNSEVRDRLQDAARTYVAAALSAGASPAAALAAVQRTLSEADVRQ